MDILTQYQRFRRAEILLAISLISCTVIISVGFARDSGHGLFASLAQLEILWVNEKEIVRAMEAILNVSRILHPPIEMYDKLSRILIFEISY